MIAWMIGGPKDQHFWKVGPSPSESCSLFWKTVGPARAQRSSGGSTKTARPSLIEFGTAGHKGAVFDLMYDLWVERPTVYSIRRPGVAIRTRT